MPGQQTKSAQIDPAKLRAVREKANVSLAEMAVLHGVSENQVRNYESGTSQLSTESLHIWAKECKVSIDSLYTKAEKGAFKRRRPSRNGQKEEI